MPCAAWLVSTLTERAKNVSSPPHLNEELQHLQRVFTEKNGYPEHLVKTVINKTAAKTKRARTPREVTPVTITIPFIGATSYKIARIIRQFASVDVMLSSDPTLKTYLNASGKNVPKTCNQKGVVYQIDCSCSQSYIGETGRPINIRIDEHRASTKKGDLKSAISQHIHQNPEHSIMWDNIKIINKNKHNAIQRKLYEAITIKRIKPELNRDQGLDINSAFDSLI